MTLPDRIARRFLATRVDEACKLQAALDSGELELLRNLSHDLASTAGTLGADGLSSTALALQAARVLERQQALLPDARFLLVAEAFVWLPDLLNHQILVAKTAHDSLVNSNLRLVVSLGPEEEPEPEPDPEPEETTVPPVDGLPFDQAGSALNSAGLVNVTSAPATATDHKAGPRLESCSSRSLG